MLAEIYNEELKKYEYIAKKSVNICVHARIASNRSILFNFCDNSKLTVNAKQRRTVVQPNFFAPNKLNALNIVIMIVW